MVLCCCVLSSVVSFVQGSLLVITMECDRRIEKLREIKKAAAGLGCALEEPFMALSFLALPVIPELKLTDRGLFDVNQFAHVSLFVE